MAGPAATGYHPPPTRQRLACPALPLPWTRRSMPCPALPLPCLALPCPALPCLAPALQRPRSACVGPHGERSACRTTASRSQGTQWEPPRMTWTRTVACQTERPATPRQSSPQPRSHEDGPGAARPNGLSQSETGTRRGQMQALLHMIQQQQAVSRLANGLLRSKPTAGTHAGTAQAPAHGHGNAATPRPLGQRLACPALGTACHAPCPGLGLRPAVRGVVGVAAVGGEELGVVVGEDLGVLTVVIVVAFIGVVVVRVVIVEAVSQACSRPLPLRAQHT